MSTYLYIEMLIRLVCGSQDVSQAENKVRLVLAAMLTFTKILMASHRSQLTCHVNQK